MMLGTEGHACSHKISKAIGKVKNLRILGRSIDLEHDHSVYLQLRSFLKSTLVCAFIVGQLWYIFTVFCLSDFYA